MIGWLHPNLVLPLRFAELYSPRETDFILAHELAHLQRKDSLFIAWALVLKCIYWFNPLIYLAYRLFRLDQELACDQWVLTSVPQKERKSYGLTILKTVSQPEMMLENFQAGCFWFTFSQMKERIAMINHHRNSKGRSMLALLSMIVLGFTTLTFAASDMVKDPSTGKMVTAPEYGGTLTFAQWETTGNADIVVPSGWVEGLIDPVLEKLGMSDWAAPRDEFEFVFLFPPDHTKGALAESWSQPDSLTYIVKVRQGVRWHDKAPMNGRALTAQDIEYNYHRLLGLGSGFTEPKVRPWELLASANIESVTATDESTVVFKLEKPTLTILPAIVDSFSGWMYLPEVIKEHGDAGDWENLVGTGPYMLTDRVEGSSVTWDRNPDYWGTDEKYPENRLPYIDTLRALIMPEVATQLAGLRTGRLDTLGVGSAWLRSLDQLESLQQTNPELVIWSFTRRSDNGVGMNIQVEPFDDIRVRKAMQMALNLEEINNSYYKGFADIIPQGQLSRTISQAVIQFEDWPEDVKKVFDYDPEGAEALLDEAGLPRGADGVRFKTEFTQNESYDLNYIQLLASYWKKIGVDVEIDVPPGPSFGAIRTARDFSMINAEAAGKGMPLSWSTRYRTGIGHNSSNVEDPWYDAKFNKASAASTIEELNGLVKELQMYGIEQFWTIFGPVAPQFAVVQPWIIGYNGEHRLGDGRYNTSFSRVWIDSALKKEMGH